MSEDCYYLGATRFTLDGKEAREGLLQRLRQYLALRNLSILVGNGCSIPLGAPLIGDVQAIVPELKVEPYSLLDASQQAKALATLDLLTPKAPPLGIEALLAVVSHLRGNAAILEAEQALNGHTVPLEGVEALERLLKKWVYLRCHAVSDVASDRLRFHEEFLRRVLLRSTQLPRCKLFTTNYDLLLERALDNLGVLYFDGFLGTLDRTLRSESYHYDLYYPGETTEGRVSRVDRVLQMYKLHGSINWRRRAINDLDIRIRHTVADDDEYGDVMIYPSPLKVAQAHGYPYSEMFRHFSANVHQPQSVLLTVGYCFGDDHVNRLIYQALSIPSFVLVIVLPTVSEPPSGQASEPRYEVWRLIHQVNSKRILVITGGSQNESGTYVSGAGTFQEFSTKWLPDISELAVGAYVRDETRKALLPLIPDAEV